MQMAKIRSKGGAPGWHSGTLYLHFKDSALGCSVGKGPEAVVVGGREMRSPLEDANQSH